MRIQRGIELFTGAADQLRQSRAYLQQRGPVGDPAGDAAYATRLQAVGEAFFTARDILREAEPRLDKQFARAGRDVLNAWHESWGIARIDGHDDPDMKELLREASLERLYRLELHARKGAKVLTERLGRPAPPPLADPRPIERARAARQLDQVADWLVPARNLIDELSLDAPDSWAGIHRYGPAVRAAATTTFAARDLARLALPASQQPFLESLDQALAGVALVGAAGEIELVAARDRGLVRQFDELRRDHLRALDAAIAAATTGARLLVPKRWVGPGSAGAGGGEVRDANR